MPYVNIFTFQPRITIVAAVSFAALAVTGLFLYQVHAQPLAVFAMGQVVSVSPGTVDLSAQGGGADAAPALAAATSPMHEMHFANNGLVLLRGAQVISISGDMIQVEVDWGSVEFTWAVQTSSSTSYFDPTGKKVTSPNIETGDMVTVSGMLAEQGAQPVINAQYIDSE